MILIVNNTLDTPGIMFSKLCEMLCNMRYSYVTLKSNATKQETEHIFSNNNITGIIFSGGPLCISEWDNLKCDPCVVANAYILQICKSKPILAICFGAQFVAHYFGGRIARLTEKKENVKTKVYVRRRTEWSGDSSFIVHSFHKDYISKIPNEAKLVARSKECVEAFSLRNILAVQFHPEMSSCGPKLIESMFLL